MTNAFLLFFSGIEFPLFVFDIILFWINIYILNYIKEEYCNDNM